MEKAAMYIRGREVGSECVYGRLSEVHRNSLRKKKVRQTYTLTKIIRKSTFAYIGLN